MNQINILQTLEHKVATKTFSQHNGEIIEKQYDSGREFNVYQITVESIEELGSLLTVLKDHPNRLIIRGELLPKYSIGSLVTRTLYDDPEEHKTACFKDYDEGLNWVMIDFDDVPLPQGTSPKESIEILINTLPTEFHNASYYYQFSSSAGVYGWDPISIHIYFWFKNKITNVKLRQWGNNLNQLRQSKVVDTAMFNAVQAHYTADPIFVNIADPLGGNRSGYVKKQSEEVDLVYIPEPDKYINFNGKLEKLGSQIYENGQTTIVSESFQDKLNAIGQYGEFRETLKAAINHYCAKSGTNTDRFELANIIRTHWNNNVSCLPGAHKRKNYMGRDLDRLISWGMNHVGNHTPFKKNEGFTDQQVAERIKDLQKKAETELLTGWEMEFEDSKLRYEFISGECGQGKTEELINRIGNHPRRYICSFPSIKLIDEVMERLETKYGDLRKNVNYKFKKIHSEDKRLIVDDEDESDDNVKVADSVNEQISKFKLRIDKARNRNVVLFITHQALFQGDWRDWRDFEFIMDEIPDPITIFTKKFTQNYDILFRFFEVAREEGNYYRLRLTDLAEAKFKETGDSDAVDEVFMGLMETCRSFNMALYALKSSWDNIKNDRVRFVRLIDPTFLSFFKSVTIMGDEFEKSILALAWTYTHGVEWTQRSDWQPRIRKVPLSSRVRIHYFAAKGQARSSMGLFRNEDKGVLKTLRNWMENNVEVPTLITTNLTNKNMFPSEPTSFEDIELPNGDIKRLTIALDPKFLWQSPKMAGIDAYKKRCSVAWFAALRPGNDDIEFYKLAVGLNENEIIEWREYNALYQFIMRINTRVFESDQECDVYVFDEYQAEYLKNRFGGCLGMIYHKDAITNIDLNKGGRPVKDETKGVMTQAERTRLSKQRKRKRDAKSVEIKQETMSLVDFVKKMRGEG